MSIDNSKLETQINLELDKAEEIWKKVHLLFEKSERVEALNKIPSKIPGFPFLENNNPQVADFIALVLDIRKSTEHLIQAISERTAKVSQLQRVFYETTAINTLGLAVVSEYKGGITEFLGDGFLALFKVENQFNPIEIYSAHNSAKKCITLCGSIVNKILFKRYGLPELKIGVGLAFSRALITIVGNGDNLHPKAIGECVYRASKLAFGNNEIYIDDRLEKLWPTEKGGKIKFSLLQKHLGFNGYKLELSK